MVFREVYKAGSFKNIEENGVVTGFQFDWKQQYYRSITLSIVRDLGVTVDGVEYPKEALSLVVNGEAFSLSDMATVIDSDYRWEFGEWATMVVKCEGGLAKGPHHVAAMQHIAPSYMPFPWIGTYEADFVIE